MKETILISEVAHTGEVHFQVNSCFVEMISVLHPTAKIIFNAERTHSLAVKTSFEQKHLKNVDFLPFDGFYNEKKYNWGSRIFGEWKQIINILQKGRLLTNNTYVWTCLFPTGHLFLSFLNLFQNNSKHVIILHGELEYLKTKGKKKSEVFLGFILKLAMNLSSKKTQYIVLGGNIKKRLHTIISKRIIERTHSILHPYNFFVDESLSRSSSNSNDVLVIGAIGTQMLSKNSNYLSELAKNFRDDVILNKIVFRTIGRVLPELYQFETDLVHSLYSDSFVSQKQFEIEISKLDFIVFFYDNKSYELCASGAIFEAIRMNIPIISIKNNFFDWLFDKYGEMGFLCADLEGVKIIVDKLKKGCYIEEKEKFKQNMIDFKIKNDLNTLALSLKNII